MESVSKDYQKEFTFEFKSLYRLRVRHKMLVNICIKKDCSVFSKITSHYFLF
jgi:hypothetical protein